MIIMSLSFVKATLGSRSVLQDLKFFCAYSSSTSLSLQRQVIEIVRQQCLHLTISDPRHFSDKVATYVPWVHESSGSLAGVKAGYDLK